MKTWRAAWCAVGAAFSLTATAPGQARVYVDKDAPEGGNGTSWVTAVRTLDAGLAAADALVEMGQTVEVWVAEGTYYPPRIPAPPSNPPRPDDPPFRRDVSFRLRDSVAIYGGFAGAETSRSERDFVANLTVLSGDLANNDPPLSLGFANDIAQWASYADNARSVVVGLGVGGGARLDGFLITGGGLHDYPVGQFLPSGGGIQLESASPTIANCTIFRNRSITGGGVSLGGGQPRFINCRIVGNWASQFGGGVWGAQAGTGGPENEALFVNSVISGNRTEAGRGGGLFVGKPTRLINCTIANNRSAPGFGGGLHVSRGLVMANCIVWGNQAGDASTAQFRLAAAGEEAYAVQVTATLVQGGSPAIFRDPAAVLATLSVAGVTSADPVFLQADGVDGVRGSLDDNLRIAPFIPSGAVDVGDDALVFSGQPDLDGNRRIFDGNGDGIFRVDLGAYERASRRASAVLYVNAGRPIAGPPADGLAWATAYRDLGEALRDARNAVGLTSQVWVAAGVYRPGIAGARTSTFELAPNVSVLGGFVGTETTAAARNPTNNPTMLSGDLAGNDQGASGTDENAYHVVTARNVTAAVLDGFTISAGNANGNEEEGRGGGVLVVGGSVTLASCRIERNLATRGAGLYSTGAAMLLRSCTVENNAAGGPSGELGGGGVYFTGAGSSLRVEGGAIRLNTAVGLGGGLALGGGIVADVVAPVIEGNTALAGGGVATGGTQLELPLRSTVRLAGARVVGNSARFGGGVAFGNATDAVLHNVLVSGNRATQGDGGGLRLAAFGDAVLHNCTFFGNTAATPFGGGISISQMTAAVFNSVLWGNSAGGGAGVAGQIGGFAGAEVASHCTIQGYVAAPLDLSRNEGTDPLFVDADGPDNLVGTPDDNLRLPGGSPAVDSGDPRVVPADIVDIDGDGDRAETLPFDIDRNVRLSDEPSTPNTGSGFAPHVDRGAFELSRATAVWRGPAAGGPSGSWGIGSNWVDGAVPTLGVRAIFDERAAPPPASFTVQLSSASTAFGLQVGANTLTFNLAGGNLTLTAPTSNDAPTLLVSGPAASDPRLTVRNSGPAVRSIGAASTRVGAAVGESGVLDLVGPRVNLGVESATEVGVGGMGSLSVTNQAALSTGSLRAAIGAGSSATLVVAGASTSLEFGGFGTEMVLGDGGAAQLTVSGGATLATGGAAGDIILGRRPGASGTLRFSGPGTVGLLGAQFLRVGDQGAGVLEVLDQAQLTTVSSAAVIGAQPGSVGVIHVGEGAIWRESQTTVLVGGGGRGTVSVAPGGTAITPFDLSIRPGGEVVGGGTLRGTVFNFGTIRPQGPTPTSTGILTIEGSYRQLTPVNATQADSGTLVLDVAGTTPGSGHDQLRVRRPADQPTGGGAELGGGLQVTFAPGFVPPPDLELALVLTDAPATRQFDVAFLPALGAQQFLNLTYRGRGPGSSVRLLTQALQTPLNFQDPRTFETVGTPQGVAAGNLDGDLQNLPDLAVVVPGPAGSSEAGRVILLFNDGVNPDGSWRGFRVETTSIAVGLEPLGVAIGDLNNDARPEVVVTNAGSQTISILSRNGSGGFGVAATLPSSGRPQGVVIADIDGDLDEAPDLVVTRSAAASIETFRKLGLGGLAFQSAGVTPTGANPVFVLAFDPDQIKDLRRLAIANRASNSVSLLRNVAVNPGEVTYERVDFPVGGGPVHIVATDLGVDSRGRTIKGLITANRDGGGMSVLTATGPGVAYAPAVEIPVGRDTRAVAAVDLDLDGDKDIAVVTDVSGSPDSDLRVRALRNDLITDETPNEQLTLVPDQTLSGAGENPLFIVGANLTGNADGRQDLVTINNDGGRGPARRSIRTLFSSPPPRGPAACNVADVVSIGGFPPPDGELTVDDYTSFINAFAGDEALADIVSIGGFPPADGELTVDDYTSFINAFAEGC